MDAGRDFLFQGRKPFLIAGGRVEMQLWSYGYRLPPPLASRQPLANIGGKNLVPGNPFTRLGPFYEFDPIPQYQGRFWAYGDENGEDGGGIDGRRECKRLGWGRLRWNLEEIRMEEVRGQRVVEKTLENSETNFHLWRTSSSLRLTFCFNVCVVLPRLAASFYNNRILAGTCFNDNLDFEGKDWVRRRWYKVTA
jgi:hypothetical protein